MKNSKEIFRDILISCQTNCVLKIKLKGLDNPIITAVDRVTHKTIILKPTCLYGYTLAKRSISLTDIESVTRYNTLFNHPLFEKLRYIKNNISDLRRNFGSFTDQRSAHII
jgi:hypothetical protein